MTAFRSAVLHALPCAVLLAAGSPAQSSISLDVVVYQGTHTRIDVNPGLRPGTSLPEGSDPDHITAFGSSVLFRAWMGQARGHELWISDGTVPGTHQLYDIEPGGPDDVRGHIAVLNGKAYFSSRSPGDGIELWVTDGVTTRLFMNLDGGPGDSYPEYLTRIGQRIFFAAQDEEGAEPWVTDGTVAGTRRLMNINTQPNVLPTQLDSGSNPRYFAGYALAVVFQADDGIHGRELWFTDGNNDTHLLADIYPGNLGGDIGSLPEYMTAAHPGLGSEKYVVFAADTSVDINGIPQRRRLLWVTDFTPAGTRVLFGGYNVLPSDFVSWGHSVFFSGWVVYNGNPSTVGWGVWLTDGTPGGTRPMYTKVGGSGLAQNMHLTMGGDRYLYMSADVRIPSTSGRELVRIDVKKAPFGFGLFELDPNGAGQPANTASPHSLIGARGDRKPLAVAGNKLFMAATVYDAFVTETELVVVDNGGTSMVEDWGCGNVWLYATDPLIDPALAPSTITFTGNSSVPNAVNQVLVGVPSPNPPASLSALFGPLPVPNLGGCLYYLDPGVTPIFLPPDVGNWYSNIVTLPNQPGLIGVEFMAQMLTLSTGPIPNVQASNPVRMVVGS